MIIWISGNSRSGKTTLAKQMAQEMPRAIILDGDDMRKSISRDCGFNQKGREESNLRVARLAANLASQGFPIVVSTICPYRSLREEVRKITSCHFIILEGGIENNPDFPFEY